MFLHALFKQRKELPRLLFAEFKAEPRYGTGSSIPAMLSAMSSAGTPVVKSCSTASAVDRISSRMVPNWISGVVSAVKAGAGKTDSSGRFSNKPRYSSKSSINSGYSKIYFCA